MELTTSKRSITYKALELASFFIVFTTLISG